MNNNELYHYGVPGMRWGHRKAVEVVSKTDGRMSNKAEIEDMRNKKINLRKAKSDYKQARRDLFELNDAMSKIDDLLDNRDSELKNSERADLWEARKKGKEIYDSLIDDLNAAMSAYSKAKKDYRSSKATLRGKNKTLKTLMNMNNKVINNPDSNKSTTNKRTVK